MVNIKKNIVLFLSLVLLLVMAYSVTAVPQWGMVYFPSTPFAQNGVGLMGDSCQKNVDDYFQGNVSAVCSQNSSWDLSATYMTYDKDTIYFKVTGNNFQQARFCGGTKNVSLTLFMNSDGQTGTGNFFLNKPSGYDYAFYFNGTFSNLSNVSSRTAQFFAHNGTLINQNGTAFRYNVTPVVEVNVTLCNGSTYTQFGFTTMIPPTVIFAVNKSYFDRPVSFNSTIAVLSSNNPVSTSADSLTVQLDKLGVGFGESFNKNYQGFNNTNFNPESKFGCAQYTKTNATACENNTAGEQCKWDNGFNDCFSKASTGGGTGFSCTQFCGECSTQVTCVNNTKCKWDSDSYNFKMGTKGTCMEQYFSFGKNCDSSCGDCSSSALCSASKYPDPTGQGGAGCKWVNNSFGQNWCTLSTFNTESLSCTSNFLEKCFTSATCSAAGGTWDSSYNYCKSSGNGEICFDGFDNDNDNTTDCSDLDCKTKTFCGGDINVISGGYNSTDQFDCLQQKYMKDFIVETQPTDIATDPTDNGLTNNNTHLDLTGLAIGESGDSLFFSFSVKNVSSLALCGTGQQHGNKTATYVLLLDVDSNTSTGCGVNLSNSNKTGIEYQINYFINYTANGNFTEVRTAKACSAASNIMVLTGVRLMSTMEDGQAPNKIMGCRFNKVSIGVVSEDISDPSKFKVTAAVFDTTTNLSYPNDTLTDVIYKSGQVDFKPIDCFSNPTACGSAFSSTGGGKFMPFQDCFSNLDTDGNGKAGCADPFCGNFPSCQSSSTKYNSSADVDPPTVISTSSYPFKSFVDIKVITDEPTNLSIIFYNQSAVCAESAKNGTVIDTPKFEFDNFKPYHGLPVTNTTPKVAGIFGPGVTLFFKTTTCDKNGNCAVSGCLNFTVSSASASENVSFKFELPSNSSTNSLLGSLNFKIKNGTQEIQITNATVGNLAQYLQNVTLVIENKNPPFTIELTGVDLTKTLNTNLTNGINATNFSNNGTFIGLGSDVWNELVQNTGADTIKLNISIPNSTPNTSSIYTSLFKCASDNITSCTNVTANVTKLGGGNTSVDWVYWEIPASLGFSVYGYSGAGNTGTASSGSSGSTGGGGGGSSITPAKIPAVAVVTTPEVATQTPVQTATTKEEGSTSKTGVVPKPTEKDSATELTTVSTDGSSAKETIKQTEKLKKYFVKKTFDQLFGASGSGIGALIVLVLVVVIIVGAMYYKKTHK